MFPTKILLAVDGSPGSERAARAATRFANSLASKLHVVLVGGRDPISGLVSGSPPLDADYELWARESIQRNARERLEGQLEKIRAGGDEIAGAHVRTGRADVEIVALAEELGAGLVVVGSRGLGRLKRAVMGSVSRNVVRHAHCPVLVVHDGRSAPISGPILAADDGSREATEAIGAGAEISAATGGAGLHVVHVIDPDPYMPYPGPEAWDGWQEHLERDARVARSWVEERAEGLRDAGAVKTVEAHLVIGDPGREISRLADELDAGLVILGSRGLGGVRRMLLGSVSDFLVGHAPCSVMVVRQDETGDGTEG
jgi:nucleotide-binding universal stress UspA family protein